MHEYRIEPRSQQRLHGVQSARPVPFLNETRDHASQCSDRCLPDLRVRVVERSDHRLELPRQRA